MLGAGSLEAEGLWLYSPPTRAAYSTGPDEARCLRAERRRLLQPHLCQVASYVLPSCMMHALSRFHQLLRDRLRHHAQTRFQLTDDYC